jgi:NAD+ kinase
METFTVIAKEPEKGEALRDHVETFGFTHAPEDPDFIISYGGDGTFLFSEREYPGVPKLLVRDSKICHKCHDEPVDAMLEHVRDESYRVESYTKLRALYKNESLTGLNDIIIRNIEPTRALRFELAVNNEQVNGELIGDGVVVASPFGATGYFRAITGATFDTGLGVAFNNTTVDMPPKYVGDDATIDVVVTRGDAHLAADNDECIFTVQTGETITVERSDASAHIITTLK